MNNKIILAIIAVLFIALIGVLLFVGVSFLTGNQNEPVSTGDSSSPEYSSEAETNEETENPGSNEPVENLPDSTIGDDDGFEGSVIPGNGNSSKNSSESSESTSSVPSVDISGNGNSGNTGSNPGSGNTSSGPTIEDVTGDGDVTYEEYISMSGEEQQKFFDSFESTEAFFEWYNAAKAKYDAENESIEIGEGDEIDLGDYTGGNG